MEGESANFLTMSRQIGFFERYCISRTTQGFYTNVGVVSRLSQRVTPELLMAALRQMIMRNPWLVVNYFAQSSSSCNVGLEDYRACAVSEILFCNVVSFESVPTFDENLLEKIDKLRLVMDSSTLPLWRVFVYTTIDTNEQYICGCFDHAIFDGLSAVQFHKDLVKTLAEVEVGGDPLTTLFDYESDKQSLPNELPLPTELKTNLYTPSRIARLRFLSLRLAGFVCSIPTSCIKVLLPFILFPLNCVTDMLPFNSIKNTFPLSCLVPGNRPFTTELLMNKDISTKFKIIKFIPQEMRQLTTFCKKQGFTLTPLFHTVGLQCLEQTFHRKFPQPLQPNVTKSMVAVNGRRYYPGFIQNFNYGPTVSAQQITMPALATLTAKELLNKVHEVHSQIRDNLRTRQSFKDFWFLTYENVVGFLYAKLGQRDNKTNLATSNLGAVGLDETRPAWNIEEMWFVSNSSITYHFLFNMVTSPSGILNLVIPYSIEFDRVHGEINGERVKMIDIFADLLKSSLLSISQ